MRGYVNYNIKEDEENYKVIINPEGVQGNNNTKSGEKQYTLDRKEVELQDPKNVDLGLARCGLEFVNHFTSVGETLANYPVEKIEFDDATDNHTKEVYEQELEKLLKEKNENIEEVVPASHSFRSDASPKSLPVFYVHGDYTEISGPDRMRFIMKEKFEAWREEKAHYGIVNIWRPIGNPVERSPLGLVDPSTLSMSDWVKILFVHPHQVEGKYHHKEHPALVFSKDHRWVVKERMDSSMAWVFTTYDSHGLHTIPHSAVEVVGTREEARNRRSVESRMIVKYKD